MTASAPPNSAARGTNDIIAVAELGDEAKALFAAGTVPPAPPAAVARLVEHEQFPDAVKFLAHALPAREAVWWAWVCAQKAAGAEPAPEIKGALEATERWIVQPTDENRRDAMAAAEAAEFGTPAGCAALAAFMSGGSMGPPDTPPVPPGEFNTAKAVAGSVTLASVAVPEKAPAAFAECLKVGLEVADRIKLWSK